MTWTALILGLLKALPQVISLGQTIMNYVNAVQARGAGRDEAILEALSIQDTELKAAMAARDAADKAHTEHPSDDDGFDIEFERKDP